MGNVDVSAIYCDDIRSEVGGKSSYMGAYNSDLVMPSFPAQVAKLCIQIAIRFPIDADAQNITIRVLKDDVSLVEMPFPDGSVKEILAGAAKIGKEFPDVRMFTCSMAVQFANLQLETPGTLKLIVIVDGVENQGNGLRIRMPTETESKQFTA